MELMHETSYREFVSILDGDIARDRAEEAALISQLDILRARIADKIKVRKAMCRLLGDDDDDTEDPDLRANLRVDRRFRKDSPFPLVISIMRANEEHAKVSDLADGLKAAGRYPELDRSTVAAQLSSSMAKRKDLFENVGRGRWKLRKYN